MRIRLPALNVLLSAMLLNVVSPSAVATDQPVVHPCPRGALMTVALDFTTSSAIPASIAAAAAREARDLWAGSGLLIESVLEPHQESDCAHVLRVFHRTDAARESWRHV